MREPARSARNVHYPIQSDADPLAILMSQDPLEFRQDDAGCEEECSIDLCHALISSFSAANDETCMRGSQRASTGVRWPYPAWSEAAGDLLLDVPGPHQWLHPTPHVCAGCILKFRRATASPPVDRWASYYPLDRSRMQKADRTRR